MPNLHPAVDRLLHSGRYECRPHVEAFTEHELKNKNGEVVRKVGKEELEKIAHVCNAKAENGALSPVGIGHTYDDVYDDKGQLVRKFPEQEQPAPVGYLYKYSVEKNPHTGKWSLYVDEWIQKVIRDPETGKDIDGMQYSASFPRRSAEVYHGESWLDWLAMLRRAPRLDLGLEMYAKHNPDRTLYAHDGLPAVTMGRGKMRYSMDTGGEMEDPTKPPSANPTPGPEAGSSENPIDVSQMPEHREAAEAYARHTHGMHHTRIAPLMKKMHEMYAAQCGMDGDMNTPYAMGAPSATNAGPAPGTPATSAVPPTPHNPPVPEHAKMQQDQAAIEKERYERRVADLEARVRASEDRAAAAAEAEMHARYERELMQLVYEGYEGVDGAKELEFVKSRRYSRQQFDDHIELLRRLPKAPIGQTRIDPYSHTLQRPLGKETTQKEKYEKHFDTIQRYIRQGKSSAEAYELATGEAWKGSNGVLAK